MSAFNANVRSWSARELSDAPMPSFALMNAASNITAYRGVDNMTGKRSHGEGSIQPRGNAWRIRYRVNGERFERTVQGTKSDAAKALREALKSGDDGKHVAPDKISLAAWITNWLALKERRLKAIRHQRLT